MEGLAVGEVGADLPDFQITDEVLSCVPAAQLGPRLDPLVDGTGPLLIGEHLPIKTSQASVALGAIGPILGVGADGEVVEVAEDEGGRWAGRGGNPIGVDLTERAGAIFVVDYGGVGAGQARVVERLPGQVRVHGAHLNVLPGARSREPVSVVRAHRQRRRGRGGRGDGRLGWDDGGGAQGRRQLDGDALHSGIVNDGRGDGGGCWSWLAVDDRGLRGLAAGAGPVREGDCVGEGAGRAGIGEGHRRVILQVSTYWSEVLGAGGQSRGCVVFANRRGRNASRSRSSCGGWGGLNSSSRLS